MARHIAANALTLLIVAMLAIGAVGLWAQGQYRDAGPLAAPICLKVEPNSNMSRVADFLAESGAISSAFVFRSGARYEDKADKLKAGSFIVPAGASMAEIVESITRGGPSTCGSEVILAVGVNALSVRVRGLDVATGQFDQLAEFDPAAGGAIPDAYRAAREDADTRYRINFAEGVTNWQVAHALNSLDFLDGEIGDLPTEGYLAPSSYEVRVGDQRADVIAKMREAQAAILDEAWLVRDPETPLQSREEALILASIIEKETGKAEERPLVASVFVNRLNRGIRLQTDPSVIYGITGGEGVLGRGLRQSELDRQTPYNTYVIDGLPPTPIANPGKAAIEAALNPAESEFIFFVADGTGGHAFAETLQEHNRNVATWRKIERERSEAENSE